MWLATKHGFYSIIKKNTRITIHNTTEGTNRCTLN